MRLIMGIPFVRYNSWTQRADYLYIRISHIEPFGSAWGLSRESTASGKSKGDKEVPAPPTPAVQPPSKRKTETNEQEIASGSNDDTKKLKGAKGRNAHAEGEADKGKSKEKETQLEISKALKDAGKTKGLFLTATSSARQLLQTISSDSDWEWAVTFAPRIEGALAQASQIDAPANKFVNFGPTEARKGLDDKSFLQGLRSFAGNVGEQLTRLDKEVRKLKAMHASQKDI